MKNLSEDDKKERNFKGLKFNLNERLFNKTRLGLSQKDL